MQNIIIRRLISLSIIFAVFASLIIGSHLYTPFEINNKSDAHGDIAKDSEKTIRESGRNRLTWVAFGWVVFLNGYGIFVIVKSSDKKTEEIEKELNREIEESIEILGSSFNEEMKSTISLKHKFLSITRKRLLEYIGSLRDRNAINLLFGILPVVIAGFVLNKAWGAISTTGGDEQYKIFFYGFSVVFIQSFSFFFLQMFSKTLTDIKYYQNELSNVEMKLSSLVLADSSNNTDLVQDILKDIANSERNFVLQKDEKVVNSDFVQATNNSELLSKIWGKIGGG